MRLRRQLPDGRASVRVAGRRAAECVTSCAATGLTACGQQCVDLQTNTSATAAPATPAAISTTLMRSASRGSARCRDASRAMATAIPDAPGCETNLGTFHDCGSCRESCAAAHADGNLPRGGLRAHAATPASATATRPTRTARRPSTPPRAAAACGAACPADRPLCGGAPGRGLLAACAAPTPDVCGSACTDLQSDPRHCGACGTACDSYQVCERGRCSPRYMKTDLFASPTGAFGSITAIAPGGAYLVGGTFSQPVDFDPGAASDIRNPGGPIDGFLTRFKADGSYAWTRTWADRGPLLHRRALTAAGDGDGDRNGDLLRHGRLRPRDRRGVADRAR